MNKIALWAVLLNKYIRVSQKTHQVDRAINIILVALYEQSNQFFGNYSLNRFIYTSLIKNKEGS